MFKSLLIANRGEIACRIMRTARRLGIRTIAVYSDADANALHVALADVAHRIGPPEAARSYLRPDAIIEAAKAHGAEAIHPGYGFLSERIELAEAATANGIVWVGPSPDRIAAMGSKIEAKRLAEKAGVAGVPGHHGEEQEERVLLDRARAIGFPVLIKASAGGGGKGMRRIETVEAFAAELATARREAKAAFGDDRVLLEKFIGRPRHLEVQIAGDRHGNLIHLYERECSIQRNYQKVVEEAPAPHLPEAVRAKLLDAAVKLGRAISYDSLGTVEFILDAGSADPYFLEMNTRLQVEHPVTEAITGLDLVELQLRIADGERLPLAQGDVKPSGHAIEVRINAEDPAHGYRPDLGQIGLYRAAEGTGLRTDSGIRAGSVITPHYDSLLAKLIASGPDRATARARLQDALQRTAMLGVTTNQRFLADILAQPAFAETLTTGFIAAAWPDGWPAPAPSPEELALAAMALAFERAAGELGAWTSRHGFRVLGRAGQPGRFRVRVAGETVEVTAAGGGRLAARIGAEPLDLLAARDGADLIVDSSAGRRRVPFLVAAGRVHLLSRQGPLALPAQPLLAALAGQAGGGGASASDVVSPMPGLITAVEVQPGDRVVRGQTLVVQESMKLVMPLTAPVDGTVKAVNCRVGQTVAGNARLVELAVDTTG